MARCVAVIRGAPGDTEAQITGVLRLEQVSRSGNWNEGWRGDDDDDT